MKTALIYYSWSGHTARYAKERAEKENAEIFEVSEKNKPGKFKAFTWGCFASMRMKRAEIVPLTVSLEDYEKIIIMAPVWAGHPAPAINAVFDLLPAGKEIDVLLVCTSGTSSCEEKVRQLIESKECDLENFEHIKG